MRFSIDFIRAFLILLGKFFPIWGGIAILISLLGLLIAQLEEELSVSESIYFAWVTGTTVGYGDIVPTLGVTRLLAIIVAVLGIIFTGIIVATAIESAKIVVENNSSIQAFRKSVKERANERAARKEKLPTENDKEEVEEEI